MLTNKDDPQLKFNKQENETFVDFFKRIFVDTEDHSKKIMNAILITNISNYSKENTLSSLDDLFLISRGKHKIFDIEKGQAILVKFKVGCLKATNLCIYNENEIDFI